MNVRNSAQSALHVERIDVVLVQKGGYSRIQVRGDVFIYGAFGSPVAGATVAGNRMGAANDTFSVNPDSTGKATDYSTSVATPSGRTFACIVDSVSKSGWMAVQSGDQHTRFRLGNGSVRKCRSGWGG